MVLPRKIFWIFALLSVLGAFGLAAEPASPPACGGVILGFDAHRQPILPTGEFYRNRPVVPPGKTLAYSFTIDRSVDPAYASYLLDLLNLVSGQIQNYYGPPPNPNLPITVKYDDPTHPGWFFYDASTNSILISSYPAGPYHHDDDGDGRIDEDHP